MTPTIPNWPSEPTTWPAAPSPGPGKHRFPEGRPVQSERYAIRAVADAIRVTEVFIALVDKGSQFQVDHYLQEANRRIDETLEYMERDLPRNYVHQYREHVWDFVREVHRLIHEVTDPFAQAAAERQETQQEAARTRAETITEALETFEGPFNKRGRPRLREFRVHSGLHDLARGELVQALAVRSMSASSDEVSGAQDHA